ncbi:3-oxoadipate enol-lactonase [Halocynthiibacter namhaensis]|uniref:3-oxoadipate enol-lactonase n=1 Tax=Halocynthiibacter namhaensis TaxID=1290553 RepID=UPI0005793E1D|nr:3-oxoadipate enol-lactonase [Halocynthiibacter namhaensis]
MPFAEVNGTRLHYLDEGPRGGAPLVMLHALGTNLRLWDAVLPHLPDGLRIIRVDLRGHGQSDAPPAPYSMGALVRDVEGLLDHLKLRNVMLCGLSLGGMIAQGLAVKRLDQIRSLVLAGTAAKIGMPQLWNDRINAVHKHGLSELADDIAKHWFLRKGRDFVPPDGLPDWRGMLISTSVDGYTGCAAAVSGTDFYTPTSGLRLPTLGLVGIDDRATPPDLMRETIDLIPGSRFEIIRKAGHLTCAEQPEAFAVYLSGFIQDTGHFPTL